MPLKIVMWQKEFGIIWFWICSGNPFSLLIFVIGYASTWARLVSIRLWMNGPSLFGIAIWKFWFWRNQFIFSHNAPCYTQIVTEIRSWVHDIHIAEAGLNFVSNSKIIREISWQAPPESFFKLNIDGSRLKNGLASAGGLVKDCSGKW